MRASKNSLYSRPPRSRDTLTREIYFNQFLPPAPPPRLQTCTSKIRHSYIPAEFNKSMWQLLRENKELTTSISQEQKHMLVLGAHEKKLIKKIKQHREKNTNTHSSEFSSEGSKKQTFSTTTTATTGSKPTLARRTNTSTSSLNTRYLADKSLHEEEKRNRIDGIRRQKQVLKAVLLENKFKSLAGKKAHVGELHERREFWKDQKNMIKFLESYKVRKQKEKERLKYEEIHLQSKAKYVDLINKRNDKWNKVEELRLMTILLDQYPDFDQENIQKQ